MGYLTLSGSLHDLCFTNKKKEKKDSVAFMQYTSTHQRSTQRYRTHLGKGILPRIVRQECKKSVVLPFPGLLLLLDVFISFMYHPGFPG